VINIWDYSRIIKSLRIIGYSSPQIGEVLRPTTEIIGDDPSDLTILNLAFKEKLRISVHTSFSTEPRSLYGFRTFVEGR